LKIPVDTIEDLNIIEGNDEKIVILVFHIADLTNES